jgi:NADH-quinone oxidoreductase subunit A
MLEQYFPVLIMIVIALGLGVVALSLGKIVGGSKPNLAKSSAYECGFDAFDDARMPFDVRFYLVAILFIIFDLETAFLFPWAAVIRKLGTSGFWAMILFLFVLVVAFIYEWKKGALEWE